MEKCLISAAQGKQCGRTPIWFLRQAGRYLPEYQAVRSGVSFVELCRTPKLVKEVTLQPMRRFDLDAAIIFSDILMPCTAMGQNLTFDGDHGPQLSLPMRTAKDLVRLKRPDVSKDLGFVGEGIELVKSELGKDQALIGFAGAPLTVASYMVEGSGSKDYRELKRFLYNDAASFVSLLELIAEVTVDYLAMQVAAGADCVMLFDSWAHNVCPADYQAFVAPVMRKLLADFKQRCPVPVIYYPGQGAELYDELEGMPLDVVAVDWRVRLKTAIERLDRLKNRVSVQGNLDPSLFLGSEQAIRERTEETLRAGRQARGHIFNVGHGLLPYLSPEAIAVAIDEVRRFDKR
jgi:uroporphyrinogen decarboxylase